MTPIHMPMPSGDTRAEEFDPASQMVAEALRKSFRVLKLLMIVLVVLYFLSGWFSVKPNEVGIVLRCGRVVGAGPIETLDAVLPPGWHWSWPYPIDRWETVSVGEREVPVEFMFERTEEERTGGIKGYKYDLLSPTRDDYLITGDVNILHVSLVVKYRVSDPVAYLTNVLPMPDPQATIRSKPHERYPEYALMTDLVRNAVIATASNRNELEIRGVHQSDFLQAVAQCISDRFKDLEKVGTPLGLSLDVNSGVIAPKTGGVEGILPPRQVQEAFENVDKVLSSKVIAITRATAQAQSLFVTTAGMQYEALAEAVKKEFDLIRKASAAEPNGPEARVLAEQLPAQKATVETLLLAAAGDVRNIIKRAEIRRDQIIKEAAGDYDQFKAVLPEYERNPAIFLSQLLAETFASTMSNEKIARMVVPEDSRGIWLHIPRMGVQLDDKNKPKEETTGIIPDEAYSRIRPQ